MSFWDLLKTAGSAVSPWGAVLSAGTGLIGSLLNSNAQRDANQTNLMMNQQTNSMNKRINDDNLLAARQNLVYQTQQNMQEAARGREFESQQAELARQFNAAQAREAREYSSAPNEVLRMMAAGLNPSALNGAGTGEGSAAMASGSPVGSAPVGTAGTQGLPTSIPMQAGHVQPVLNQLGSVAQLMQKLQQLHLQLLHYPYQHHNQNPDHVLQFFDYVLAD